MYMVYLVNGNEQIIIHDLEPSSSLKAVGKIKKAVNAIDSFTFTIYPGNPGYNAVVPLKSKIYVYNDIGDQIFAGRVLYPTSSMENTGAVKRTFVCEGELGYLCDTVQKYQSVGTTAYFFQRVLEQHNSQVGSDKQITLGTVTVNKESHRNTWGYVTSFQAINDYVKEYGGEFRLRYDSGTRYFDYTDGMFTSASDTPIELSVNMISVEYTVDPTKIASGIFAAGAKLNDSGISAERLELDDVIWDNTLISQYGKIVACETWDDVTTKSALTTKATAWLQDQSSEVKKFTVTAAQLYELSYGFDDFEVGTAYPIRNPLIGLDDTVRCVSKTIDINDPTKTTLTFGDRYTTIAQAIAETSNRSQEIGKITSSVGAMDASINNLKESTSGLATQVSDLTTRMTAAEAAISAISTDVIYSTTERKIGKWIDDSDLYEKTIVISALGDGTTRSVQAAHGIADLGEVVESRGMLLASGIFRPLQGVPIGSDGTSVLPEAGVSYSIDSTNVTVVSGTDDLSGCKAYVTLRYFKRFGPPWLKAGVEDVLAGLPALSSYYVDIAYEFTGVPSRDQAYFRVYSSVDGVSQLELSGNYYSAFQNPYDSGFRGWSTQILYRSSSGSNPDTNGWYCAGTESNKDRGKTEHQSLSYTHRAIAAATLTNFTDVTGANFEDYR